MKLKKSFIKYIAYSILVFTFIVFAFNNINSNNASIVIAPGGDTEIDNVIEISTHDVEKIMDLDFNKITVQLDENQSVLIGIIVYDIVLTDGQIEFHCCESVYSCSDLLLEGDCRMIMNATE